MKLIEDHYREHRQKYIKLMSFRAGTEWDAEDVVQDAYLDAVRYIESFDGSNFDRWFRTILFNDLRKHRNAARGQPTHQFIEEEAEGIPCSHFPERITAEIYELIDTKSKIQMEVLTYYFRYGYTATDISKLTEHSYVVIHKIIQRFRNELKELYD